MDLFNFSMSKIYDRIEGQCLGESRANTCGNCTKNDKEEVFSGDFGTDTEVTLQLNCQATENDVANADKESMGISDSLLKLIEPLTKHDESPITMVQTNEKDNSKTTENLYQSIVENADQMETCEKQEVFIQEFTSHIALGISHDDSNGDTLLTRLFNPSVDSAVDSAECIEDSLIGVTSRTVSPGENEPNESENQIPDLLMNLSATVSTEVQSAKRHISAENSDESVAKRPKESSNVDSVGKTQN